MNYHERPCAQCGHAFATTSERSKRRFCSAACRALAWRGRNGAAHVRRAAQDRPAPVGGHDDTPQDLAAVLAPPTLDAGAVVALEAAWNMTIADRAERAEEVLVELTEAQAREALHSAVVLLSAAIYDGGLAEHVAAAGLLTEPEAVTA